MIASGYILHLNKKRDYAFWLYLFGLLIIASGIMYQKKRHSIENVMNKLIPEGIKNLRPVK